AGRSACLRSPRRPRRWHATRRGATSTRRRNRHAPWAEPATASPRSALGPGVLVEQPALVVAPRPRRLVLAAAFVREHLADPAEPSRDQLLQLDSLGIVRGHASLQQLAMPVEHGARLVVERVRDRELLEQHAVHVMTGLDVALGQLDPATIAAAHDEDL